MHSETNSLILLSRIWIFISPKRKKQLACLFVLMLLSATAEVISLGAVLPFLTALSDPHRLYQIGAINKIAQFFTIRDSQGLVLPVTLIFAISAFAAGSIRLCNLWANGRLAAAIGSDLSLASYRNTLYQPYEWHTQQNSSQLITVITTQIGRTVAAINCSLQLATAAIVSTALSLGLVLINWKIAASSFIIFGFAYLFLAFYSKNQLIKNSEIISNNTKKILRSLQEGLGAIRDLLLENTQQTYLAIYSSADRPQRYLEAKNQFLASFPRYSLEALGMILIAALGYILSKAVAGQENIIPLLGTLALGSQRLLPALQQVYANWSNINSFRADIYGVTQILRRTVDIPLSFRGNTISIDESLQFKNVYFGYSGNDRFVNSNVSFKVNAGEIIGIVGTTGSGKSTLMDLLVGLLQPTSGSILVNNIDINDPLNSDFLVAWRASISHVPQSIYLADCSIAENIAFGVKKDNIDYHQVIRAAKNAMAFEFIQDLPDKFNTFVGERGVRLSGGQRQRIGIARAMYKKSKIIILDEATSALDTKTESEVMRSIYGFDKSITVFMIAHRLSTLNKCDRIFNIEEGMLISIKKNIAN